MKIKTVRVHFDKLRAETQKSFLIRAYNQEHWFPKSLVKKLSVNRKMAGSFVIPSWLYIDKFGIEPSIEDAELIIEEHIPERISQDTKVEIDQDLKR